MKRVFCGVVLMCLLPTIVMASTCASPTEQSALNHRALQSQLMVSALACGQQDNYNQYMSKFKRHLTGQQATMQKYFKRVYTGSGKREMTSFLTALANESSVRSLQVDSDKYCSSSDKLFDKLLDSRSKKVSKIANKRQFVSLHDVEKCE